MTRPMDYLPEGYPAMREYRDARQAELALDESKPVADDHKLVTYPPPETDHEVRIKQLEATQAMLFARLGALEKQLGLKDG